MALEKLFVENFGPIKKADLELRKLTILIGEQASGKSVLAKLITLSRDLDILIASKKKKKWWEINFDYFGLSKFYSEKSYFFYSNKDFETKFQDKELKFDVKNALIDNWLKKIKNYVKEQNDIDDKVKQGFENEDFDLVAELETRRSINVKDLRNLQKRLKSILHFAEYIPAERIIASFTHYISYDDDYYLGKFLEKFAEKRKVKSVFKLPIINIEYSYDEENYLEEENQIFINKETVIPMYQSASGIQSLVPIQVIIDTANPNQKHLFIVEEPELNLYPTTQRKIMEYLVEKCTKNDNRLIITTHSPYILTALSNMIEAKNIVKQNPEMHEEVAALIPPQYWLDFDDVAAYFVGSGTAYSIRDEENQNIDATPLDEVSNELGGIYDKLLDLKYATNSK